MTEKIEKRGRYYCIVKGNIVLGRRRSYSLASQFVNSLYFKPMRKLKMQIQGEIGSISGFRIYGEMSA